jgi:acyl transferase domain-containing protein
VKKAYLLEEDPLTFDHDFFGISAKEAESMDPQQRIALETVYESIESAGYSISKLRGSSTSVFVGQMTDDYRDLMMRDLEFHPQHAGTGISRCILANRISYSFDWRGPSVNIDTACSSSLVGLHQAVQSLRSAESELAVVVGVNLVFGPDMFSVLSSVSPVSHYFPSPTLFSL